MRVYPVVVATLLVLGGCGRSFVGDGSEGDAGTSRDAGSSRDSGTAASDAGEGDSDAGERDAGPADVDGGEPDGAVPDAGDTGGDDPDAGDAGPGDAGDGGGGATDAGHAGAPDAAVPDAGAVDAGPDTVLYGPLTYRSFDDSPFRLEVFLGYQYFEDFEDHLLSVPGVYTSSTPTSTLYPSYYVDSVDGDDGHVDGFCLQCDSLFTPDGVMGASLVFDPLVLGALPTHVGFAWTDGVGATVTVTFYGPAGTVAGTITRNGLGDGTFNSSVGEDRFFGIYHRDGISRVTVKDPGAGVEIDHLFYSR